MLETSSQAREANPKTQSEGSWVTGLGLRALEPEVEGAAWLLSMQSGRLVWVQGFGPNVSKSLEAAAKPRALQSSMHRLPGPSQKPGCPKPEDPEHAHKQDRATKYAVREAQAGPGREGCGAFGGLG